MSWLRWFPYVRDLEDSLAREIQQRQEFQDHQIHLETMLEHYQKLYEESARDSKELREKIADLFARKAIGRPIFQTDPSEKSNPGSHRSPFSPTHKVQARQVVSDLTRQAYRDDIARLEAELNLKESARKDSSDA